MKIKFLRQQVAGKKKLKIKWRRPRGIHSKLRLKKAGHRKKPSVGFRSQRKDRRSSTSLVTSINDLTNAKQSILLSSKLGLKKKLEILKRASELKLKVLNVKGVDEFIKKSRENIEKRKSENKKREVDKKKSKEKIAKDADKSKKKEEEKTKHEVAEKEK
ncbi:hypothetical protein HYV89_01430 [Candidatus Woesearchaeota archaeon]|nr:hypothetical protein [Candidatus Woesearchaeota archaeon]